MWEDVGTRILDRIHRIDKIYRKGMKFRYPHSIPAIGGLRRRDCVKLPISAAQTLECAARIFDDVAGAEGLLGFSA